MKKAFAILLTVCMLLPLVAMLPIGAATPAEGYTFGADKWYYANGTLSDAPRTFEMWIKVSDDSEDLATLQKNGKCTVISNYNGFNTYGYFHVAVNCEAIKSDGVVTGYNYYPAMEWSELHNNYAGGNANGNLRSFNFKNTTLTPGEWTHISIVINAEMNYVSCYKNGEHVQNNSTSIKLCDITKNVVELPVVIGNDNRYNTPDLRVFQGSIASISLFGDKRTADEIASDYANGADYTDEHALAHWELTANGAPVADKSGNGIGLTLSQYWLTEEEMQAIRGNDFNPAYSFAVVGDIQYITEYDAANGTTHVADMHKWIADNITNKNIKYMMGMGDVTNRNTDAEWTTAYNAIKQLNGLLPYSVINGNHDLYEGTTSASDLVPNAAMLGPKAIDSYFGVDEWYKGQFTGENGGLYEADSVRNTYYKFTVGTTKWLIINLDFAPSDEILTWANQVVASHPDHKVIMTTHGYVHMDGTAISDEDSGSLWGATKNNGEEMWTKFVSLHENIVMVLSGHMESNNIMMKQVKGVHGNTVTQFLIDQQAVDKPYMASEGKPLGLIAMFYFDEDGKNVSVEWYSPLRDKYFQTCNQISFDMTAECEAPEIPWSGVSITPEGSGTKNDPYIIENGGNLLWMANQIKQVDLTAGETPTFANTYFKQICDIDLAGLCIKSIGYYHTSQSTTASGTDGTDRGAFFGGHYDGGGYSIKNGRVIPASGGHEANINWCDGLFGCIYGATIENVTLDNVTIWSRGLTGGIVGRATAPRNVDAPSDFNVISNCHIKSNCRIVAVWQLGDKYQPGHNGTSGDLLPEGSLGYNTRYRGGVVGGICGMAYATTIKGCTNAVEMSLDGTHGLAGGIAGTAGYNTVIENCAFTGGITLTDMNTTLSLTFGGIVGLLAPNLETETMNHLDDYLGTLTIRNCYNSGYFTYTGADALPEGLEMHWGGILGHAKMLEKVTADKCYLIENCYNLYAKEIEDVLAGNANYWVGGLVGKADAGNYDTYDSLTVKNCASVVIEANGGSATASTNEYRTTGKVSMYNLPAVLAENVTTATMDEINGKLEAIRLEMLIAQNAQNGTKWYYGEGAPAVDANVGDMYLDTANGDVYVLELTWKKVGNIKGDKGEQGDPGEKGEDGKDAVAPTVEIKDGYWYINGENTHVKATGEDGKDAVAPIVEIKDGYWYINGENTHVKATGENGKDAVAPQVRINEETNEWEISTDSGLTWETTGVKATGKDGAAGTMGSVVTMGPNGNWFINGEDTGVAAKGEQGDPGKNGNTWTVGEGVPEGTANAGDLYYDKTTCNVYQYKDGAWALIGNIKGADGEDGADGADGEDGINGTNGADGKDGNTWTVGEGVPEGAANAGDMYYDKTTCNVYQYKDGAWALIGSIKGADGEDGADGADGEDGTNGTNGADAKDGNTWTVGEGVPEGTANAGDLYYDKTNCNVYRYTNGAWVLIGNIKGDTGAQGPQGETGATGATGAQGEKGEKGDKGEDGADAAVSDSTNTAGGTNTAGTASTSDGKSGNGLAIAAIVIAIVLGGANAALIVVLLLKKKKA